MSIVPFLIAKAHANHSRSPSQAQLNSMINADKISDVESVLQGTYYGTIMDDIRPSVDLPAFETSLRKDYAKLLRVYRRAANGRVEDMLNAFTIALEAENMDLIFQAIIRDNVDEELEQVIIPVGKFGMRHYLRIMENSNASVATDFIVYPELRAAAKHALNLSQDPDEQIFLLSSALSHTAYSVLGKVAPKWIKLEADFLNLETVCRAINLGIDPTEWLIPNIGVIYRQRQTLRSMNSPREVLSYMVDRFPVSHPIRSAMDADDPVAQLETEALQYLYYQRYHNFLLYGNREESVLDYFSIKRAEIEDISRILTSKVLTKTSRDDLRKMIYPIYSK